MFVLLDFLLEFVAHVQQLSLLSLEEQNLFNKEAAIFFLTRKLNL